MDYGAQAVEARREAQIAREEADVSEGLRRAELLDRSRQLLDRADRLDRYAAQDARECEGHPAGPFDPMGETVYCDGSCVA